MKVAVLLSGEYRKFSLCRKTMKFLDDPRVDIYFSTWNKSVYSNNRLNLHVEEYITENEIKNVLGKSATIEIENSDTFLSMRYNCPMMHRWLRGMELIRLSNIHYDYVIVLRPDIFFCYTGYNLIDTLLKYKNSMGITWAVDGKIGDEFFISDYMTMIQFFSSLDVSNWINSRNDTNWHVWLSDSLNASCPNIIISKIPFAFCRFWVQPQHTLQEIRQIESDWKDLLLLKCFDELGSEHAYNLPLIEKFQKVLKKWDSGYFNKYKI